MARSPRCVLAALAVLLFAVGCNDGKSGLTPAQACPQTQTLCGSVCATLATDPGNCGSCGKACAAGTACVAGACKSTCPPGGLQCPFDGGIACVNPQSDNLNCGACGTTCPTGKSCQSGTCQLTCPPGTLICPNEPGLCANPATDNQNCGGCSGSTDGGPGVVCPAGELCSNGTCQATCAPNYATCKPPADAGVDAGTDAGQPYCAQLGSDPNNCGSCGNACGPGGACCTGASGPFCANILYDAANCGQCGHSCGADTCEQGLCTPSVLSWLQFGASDLTQDAQSLYYLANLEVWQLPKGGGSPTIVSFPSGFSPQGLAVDSTHAYWSDVNTGWMWEGALPADGGFANPVFTTLFQPLLDPVPFGVAVDAHNAYYAGYDAGGQSGVIVGIPLQNVFVTTLASGSFQPNGLALDAVYIYWTDALHGQVLRTNKFGAFPVEVLATGQSVPAGLALDGNNLYWANSGNGTVMRGFYDGGTPVAIATGQLSPQRVAIDGTTIYWTDNAAGMVMKAPLQGGPVQPVAYQQYGPDGIVVDGQRVYWTNNGSVGAVMSAPK